MAFDLTDRVYKNSLLFYLGTMLFAYANLVSAVEDEFLIGQHDDETVLSLNICKHIVSDAYRQLDINVRYVPAPGRRSLIMGNEGKTDAEVCRIDGISEEYPNLIKVNVPICAVNIVVATITPKQYLLKERELKELKLGSIRGMKAAENYFKDHDIDYVNHYDDLYRLLESGLIDAIIATEAETNVDPDLVTVPVKSFPLFHYVNASNKHLIEKLETILPIVIDAKIADPKIKKAPSGAFSC